MKRPPPTYTNLGMHFVAAGAEIVLVQVEVNVRGLLAVHARRLIKSKRHVATVSQSTVRMSVATPEDQERARQAHLTAEKCSDYDRMAEENVGLHERLARLERTIRERLEPRERDGSGI